MNRMSRMLNEAVREARREYEELQPLLRLNVTFASVVENHLVAIWLQGQFGVRPDAPTGEEMAAALESTRRLEVSKVELN